ncbi:MAG TPA: vitamin K epoxide reductase family protein [Acidimicrobiales bacterium]|nr:vitamin K epoxide reductase family protein [Acidimicrobiales bacterium]
MNRTATRFGVAATALVLAGLGLSIYLTVEHFSASPSYACPTNSVVDCVKVTSSSYSEFLGVPVVLAGVLYFVVALPLHLPSAWQSSNVWLQRARWAWSGIGMVSVFWLIYGELDVGAICLYCTGVHIVTFALLVLTAIGSVVLLDDAGDGPDVDGADPATVTAPTAAR